VKSSFFKNMVSFLRTGKTCFRVFIVGFRSSGKFALFQMVEIYLRKRVSTLARFKTSRKFPFLIKKVYFCDEPWVGVFSIETNLDATFCPCYLRMKIGNLNQAPIQELWNAEPLVQIRRSFKKGRLPKVCQGQLCPVALDNKL
jgi:hypothetical protein